MEGASSTSYTYTAGTNRLATATGSEPGTYGYDSNGNTTGDGTHTYEYSQRDRLATVDSGTTATYSYDGDGRRVKKVAGATTTLYFYDNDGKLLEEYIPATNAGKDYIWLPGTYEPIGRVDFALADTDNGDVLRCTKNDPNVHLDWSLDGTSGPFVVKRSTSFTFSNPQYLGPAQSGKTLNDPVLGSSQNYAYEAFRRALTDALYFYHDDHLGTPIAMTNGAGAFVWRAEHTPFGGIYALTVGTIANNLRFPGQYFDGETGLAQNYYRDYKHNTGRYWEADPLIAAYPSSSVILSGRGRIGVPDLSGFNSSNSYDYNNPVSSVDPVGLFHYKPGTQMANPDVEAMLDCMDKCLGRDLGISAGTDKSGHGLCPPFFSQHYIGEAADISKRMNPGLKPKDVMCCAKKCGAGFAQTESDHYHVQVPAGRGGSRGQMPLCGCDPSQK